MMKPTPLQEALLALAETADGDIRRQVWPRLKELHAVDPQAHQQALALLRDHHRRLRSTPYRVSDVDSIATVHVHAPFTVFELRMEPCDEVADIVACRQAHPDIEHIALLELDAQTVCDVIELGAWRGITLEACALGDAAVAALFEHLGRSTLHTLHVAEGWSTASFVDAMIASPHLPALRDLALTHGRVGPTFFSALADWPQFGRLHALDMRSCRLGAHGVAALVDLPVPPALHRLHLGSNEMGDEGLQALASSGWLQHLRVLMLGGDEMGGTNGIGDGGVMALGQSPHLGSVEVLDLAGNNIGDAGARALAQSALHRVETLRLGSNNIGDAGAIALVQSGNMPALRHLDLGHNALTDQTIDALMDAALLPQLRTITLTWNACSAEGIAALHRAKPRLCTTGVWSS